MSAFEKLADLPIEVSSYELEGHDREYGSFTRPSTVVRLRGDGHEGIGEDVVYDVLDHIAHRDAGPVHDLSGPKTLGALCELLAELDLFSSAPPVRESSRHYRRWAYESAALDLALRQSGVPLHEAAGAGPQARHVRLLHAPLELRGRQTPTPPPSRFAGGWTSTRPCASSSTPRTIGTTS